MFFVKSKHILNIILVLFLSLFLLTLQILEYREALLKPNFSNKNDVIEILGEPHVKSITQEDTWLYIERTRIRGSMHKLGKNVLLNNNVLVVKFNKYGVFLQQHRTY